MRTIDRAPAEVSSDRPATAAKTEVVARPLRLMIIGSLPPPIGGTTVLLRQLVTDLSKRDSLKLEVLDTSGIRGFGVRGIIRLARLMFRIAVSAFRTDVTTAHLSTAPFSTIGLYILLIARLTMTPVMFRRFGGADYMALHPHIRGRLADFVIRHADLYLTETHHLIALAQQRSVSNVRWYSNSRPISKQERPGKLRCLRFVMIGHVKRDKGVFELIEAAAGLPDGVSIDIFGPIVDPACENAFAGKPRVFYRGQISPESVMATLSRYDALVLPTYHPGEGYPGVVIEAYVAGLPVIASEWQAIPEIVDETSGILVPPKDVAALQEAMLRLVTNDDLYRRLAHGAAAKAKDFDATLWTEKFVGFCRELASKRGVPV